MSTDIGYQAELRTTRPVCGRSEPADQFASIIERQFYSPYNRLLSVSFEGGATRPPAVQLEAVFPSDLLASYGFFRRRRSRLAFSKLFRQFLAGPEGRVPFCGNGDCLPGARVAALALLLVFHHEAAKSA